LRDAAHVYVYWNGKPKIIVDSDGKEVKIFRPIKRIVVLGTTQAEVLRSLNAKDRIVGISTYITKKPDFFPQLKELPTVGSGYYPDYEAIVNLTPDIVLQYSGWTPEMDEELEPFDIKVIRLGFKLMNYTSEVRSLGDILDKKQEADRLVEFHQSYMDTIAAGIATLEENEKPGVYLEWNTDYQTDTNGSLHQLCVLAGGKNIAANLTGKYPTVDAEWIASENPDIIIKFPFRKSASHGYDVDDASEMAELWNSLFERFEPYNITAITNNDVYVVGQEIVSGPRALVAIAYMAKWFHPELFNDLNPIEIHQKYIEDFQGLDYDLYERGVFVYHPVNNPDGR
jgi:iron complex transport system substrate-binding protein